LLPLIVTAVVMTGSSLTSVMVLPALTAKLMVLVPPAAFERLIASRSDPAPLSLALETVKVVADADDTIASSAMAASTARRTAGAQFFSLNSQRERAVSHGVEDFAARKMPSPRNSETATPTA
jgi:hypothetical protein